MEGLYTSVETANLDVIRSWKDPRYRRSLSAQQLERLPQHPSGSALLTDQELKAASGLESQDTFMVLTTAFGCTLSTFGGWKACGC